MDPESSRLALFTRRARSTVAVLAVGALGAGFSACGDEEQDTLSDQIDDAQEQAESALDDVDTEALQNSIDDAQEQAESALDDVDTEELKKQAEEAQKQLEDAQGN